MAMMFFQFRLKSLEKSECVSSSTGKARQNAIVKQASHLASGGFEDDVAERYLTVATKCDLLAAANRQNGCSVHVL